MRDSNFEILEIFFGSEQYRAALQLRREVLRFPLNLDYSLTDLIPDQVDHHLAAIDESKALIGCLILARVSPQVLKMRQVAVAVPRQGRGIGIALVQAGELWAIEHSYSSFILNARESAVRFYTRLGYEKIGDRFVEVSIPHFKMRKNLARQS